MNPSPEAKEKIQAYAAALSGGWAGNTDEQVLTAANTPSVANPVSAPTIAKPYTFATLMGELSDSSLTNLKSLPYLPAIINDINAGDLVACQRWIGLLSATSSPSITSGEATELANVLTATESDPSWPTHISWSQANLGRPSDLDDILESRPQ